MAYFTFSNQSVIISEIYVSRTIRRCSLFMLLTILTSHLHVPSFPSLAACSSTPPITRGMRAGVSVHVGVSVDKAGHKTQCCIHLTRSWAWPGNSNQFQSHAEDVCSLFLVENMYFKVKHLHKYAICDKAWNFSLSSLQKDLQLFVFLSTGNESPGE